MAGRSATADPGWPLGERGYALLATYLKIARLTTRGLVRSRRAGIR
jgi:hypothetical protein